MGVILDGATGQPLDTEFLLPKKPWGKPKYQQHYQVVKRQNQVQIYEDLIKDSDGNFTTSFLHRVTNVKDNRLRAVGWRSNGPYADETMPEGYARFDQDYTESPNQGIDQIIYEVDLPWFQRNKIHHVEVKLFYQSTPPSYLRQRFELASAGPRSQDTNFFYYMTSHLDTNAPDRFGVPYLKDWKLQVGAAQVKEISPKKPDGIHFWKLPERLIRFRFW
ncbi:MAG: hypothetical protein AB1847_16270 [bacterium]